MSPRRSIVKAAVDVGAQRRGEAIVVGENVDNAFGVGERGGAAPEGEERVGDATAKAAERPGADAFGAALGVEMAATASPARPSST